ncbi:MAG TPA: hypothetical protein VJ506_07095 [Candidatus Limnocylindrales bacterium]|nr:hypothetical protein [Candidatus Limnocylindrales bacterium]
MPAPLDEPQRRAVSRILALAQQFASRSRQSQAALIQEFEDAVREHVELLGPLSVEDDEDEQLVLGADGRFQGRVLVEDDGGSHWEAIGGPLDVIDHYDPVDLFADLSVAIHEQFEGGEESPGDVTQRVAAERVEPGESPWAPAAAALATDGAEADETEPASRKILRDLHEAGVYSDAEYAAKLAELDQPPGA